MHPFLLLDVKELTELLLVLWFLVKDDVALFEENLLTLLTLVGIPLSLSVVVEPVSSVDPRLSSQIFVS